MHTYGKECKNRSAKTENHSSRVSTQQSFSILTSVFFPKYKYDHVISLSNKSLSVASAHIMYFHTSPFLFMLSFFSPFGKNLAHLLKSCSRINSLGKKKKSHLILPIFLVNNCFPLLLHATICSSRDHGCLSSLPDKDFPEGTLYLSH